MLPLIIELKYFLTFSIVLLIFIAFQAKKIILIQVKSKRTFNSIILSCFILLTGITILMINSYLFPKDRSIIKNSDHHVLEHIGYRFTDSVYLVNSYNPQNSLWDNKNGILKISFPDSIDSSNCRMEIKDLYEPVFVKTNDERYHSLINQYFSLSTNNSFVIRTPTDTIINISIRHYRKDSSNYFIKWEGVEHLSSFNTFLNKGYPLNDIIYQAQTLPPQAKVDLTNFFEGTFLLRNKLISTNLTDDYGNSQTPDLTIFPGKNLIDLFINNAYNLFICGDSISIPGDSVKSEFSYDFSGEVFFWTGFGRTMGNYLHLINEGNGHLELNHFYPVRHNLESNESGNNQVNRLITTLYNPASDSTQKNGDYLFNGPFYENNRFHINADLGYLTDISRSAMQFIIKDHNIAVDSLNPVSYDIYKANDTILLSTPLGQLETDNPFNNKWIFRISDSRSQSPVKITEFYLIILIFFLFIITRLYILRGKDSLISAVELSAYILLFVFIIIRMLLLWRMYVFLPEDSPRFLNILINPEHYYWTIFPLLVFFIVWGVFLFLRIKGLTSRLTQRFSAYYFRLGAYILSTIIIYFGCRSISDRFLDIVFPLFFYFASYFFLVSIKEHNFINKGYSFFFINIKLKSLIKIAIHLITFLLLSGFFGINNGDMGFLIIFCLFLLLYNLFSSLLIKNIVKRILFVFILLIGTIYFIINHNKNITTIINTAKSITKNWSDSRLIPGKIKENISSKDYIQSRAEIFSQPVDSLLMNESYGSSKVDQLIFSSLNQWYINQYIFGNDKNQNRQSSGKIPDYFNIRPHSNQGASYTAQTTDLVVSRYLIGEHGEITVILLITILLAFILIYISSYLIFVLHETIQSDSNIFSSVILKSIILLFTTALFVWMTATNRFTFFGQDFPIISLTSKMSICLSLGIILVVLTTINNNYLKNIGQIKYMPSSLKNVGMYYFLIIYFIFSITYFAGYGLNKNIKNINKPDISKTEKNFNLPDLIKSCEQQISELSLAYIIYQISENSGDISPDVSILSFYEQEENNIREILADGNEFIRSAFEKFITDEYDKENENNLIYLNFDEGVYHIKLNNLYYFVQGID